MLYDGLVSFDLPGQPGPAIAERGARSVEALLFDGSPRVRHAECSLSAGAVLSRTYDALRRIGARGFCVGSDAQELLGVVSPLEGAPRWPELLPPRWCEQPAAFWIRGFLDQAGAAAVVRLRYTPRHRVHQGAVNGSIRLLWDVRPRRGESSFFDADVRASLATRGVLQSLSRRLEIRGRALAEDLLRELSSEFEGQTGASWGRAVVLHRYTRSPERFAALLDGFDPQLLQQLSWIEDRQRSSGRSWPAVDPHGVKGRVRGAAFVPALEECHAV